MLLLSFTKLSLQVEELTNKNFFFFIIGFCTVRSTDIYLVSICGLWAQKTSF